jgi:hypothetical protein
MVQVLSAENKSHLREWAQDSDFFFIIALAL